MVASTTGEVITNDGVTLRYIEAGDGDPVVMVHGFGGSAASFDAQIDALSDTHRVIALDLRGHGVSEKPEHGFRVARLAADLRDLLEALDLTKVTLLGHSMGCVVIWNFLDLFGDRRISRVVLVDQPPVMLRNPTWSKDETKLFGGLFGPDELAGVVGKLAKHGGVTLEGLIGSMLTTQCPPEVQQRIMADARVLPATGASQLFFDLATADLRDVLSRINKPTLYIGGRHNTVKRSAQSWICEQIPDVCHVVFEADEGGSHFMFLENPEKFNAEVAEFLAGTST